MDAVPVPDSIDHTPPANEFVNAGVVELTHTLDEPPDEVYNVGKALTVKELLTELMQNPFPNGYTTDTVPAVNPVTTPFALIDAVPVPETIDQVPPALAFVNAGVVALTQTEAAPPSLFAYAASVVTFTVLDANE